MFLEPRYRGQRSGWIEVVTGCMFSGKTEELIRRIRRATIANQKVLIFKPQKDDRYSDVEVVSHDSNAISSIPVAHCRDIIVKVEDAEVVGIDEAQFFSMDLVKVCEQLALNGVRVVIAGLDLDYRGVPFGPMPHLMAIAEYVTKVHAICPHCGNLATHSYRLVDDSNVVLLGEKEAYEPRCRTCYSMGHIMDFKGKTI